MEPGSSDHRPIATSDSTRRLPNDFVNKPVLLGEIFYLWAGEAGWARLCAALNKSLRPCERWSLPSVRGCTQRQLEMLQRKMERHAQRSRAHAGEPGSASSPPAPASPPPEWTGPALAQTLSADTVEPGSASSSCVQASQTAVDRYMHGALCRRPTPPEWAETFATSLNRHIHGATRRLADDGRRYTWEEFATYYGRHADAMWKRAQLQENLRRSRWRIIARKMNAHHRRSHPRRIVPLFEDDWLDGRTPAPEPWDDYNSDSPSRRRIVGRETF